MKRLVSIALGILTAIGGFVDIGDIVANTETGARFGMSLAWVVLVGVVGICLFAEMAGRVATVSGRAVFDLVRERLGARVALVNLVASAVETAALAVDAADGGKAYGRYLTQVLAEAEEDADAAQGTFDAIQPPDRRADELRSRLDELLSQATDTLAELRIAARRGRFAELPKLAEPLPGVAEELDDFAEAHG